MLIPHHNLYKPLIVLYKVFLFEERTRSRLVFADSQATLAVERGACFNRASSGFSKAHGPRWPGSLARTSDGLESRT